MTGSSSTNGHQTSSHDEAAARAEALAWIASQLFWERRLRAFVEAKAVAAATADITLPTPVAATEAMGHDRDDLEHCAGVNHGMETVGSPA